MPEFQISIAAARTNAGLNQKEFADKMGVSKGTVMNWEKGITEPNITQLRLISTISKVPMNFIFVQRQS